MFHLAANSAVLHHREYLLWPVLELSFFSSAQPSNNSLLVMFSILNVNRRVAGRSVTRRCAHLYVTRTWWFGAKLWNCFLPQRPSPTTSLAKKSRNEYIMQNSSFASQLFTGIHSALPILRSPRNAMLLIIDSNSRHIMIQFILDVYRKYRVHSTAHYVVRIYSKPRRHPPWEVEDMHMIKQLRKQKQQTQKRKLLNSLNPMQTKAASR